MQGHFHHSRLDNGLPIEKDAEVSAGGNHGTNLVTIYKIASVPRCL